MPRPKNKTELEQLSKANFNTLLALVDNLTEEDRLREFPPGTMNRNIRDVLAHLHAWHILFLNWYSVGMRDEIPDMPAPGYSWKTTPELNRKIFEDYSNVGLEAVRALLMNSFQDVQRIIQAHDNEELFTKKRYSWTGSTSLGSYLVSATSSHYDWALKLIRKAKKTAQQV